MLILSCSVLFFFFFSSRRRHTRFDCDWSSDVCSSDLAMQAAGTIAGGNAAAQAGRAQAQALGFRAQQEDMAAQESRAAAQRSEERRVGKECRSRWSPYD